MEKFTQEFYHRPADEVAVDLLGKVVVRRIADETLRGRIVETEAYTGESDPGSHAFRGPTPRTRIMFGPPGFVYVYFTYGAHFCMNVVTDDVDTAGAVLLRALEPLDGIETMQRNRGGRPLMELCNGPGKLCQALHVSGDENGADLTGGTVWVEGDGSQAPRYERSARVGLSAGKELPLRFYVEGSPFVSKGRPSALLSPWSGA